MKKPDDISEEDWDLVKPFVDMRLERDQARRERDMLKVERARMQLNVDDVRQWIRETRLTPDHGVALVAWLSDIIDDTYKPRSKGG